MALRRNLVLFVVTFIFSVISTADASSAARQKAFVPRRRAPNPDDTPLQTHFMIRGGALVESTSVAKVATAVSLLQGTAAWLDPKSVCQSYGIEVSAVAELVMRRLGLVLIQMGILGVCLFFIDCGIQTALGAASLGLAADILRSLFISEHKTIGFGLGPQLVMLAQCSIVAYVNLSNQECSNTVNKVNALLLMLIALALSLSPKFVLEVACGMQDFDDKTIGIVSSFGYWCVAYAVYIGGLTWDIGVIKALTWSRLLVLLIHFVPSKGESVGLSDSKQTILFIYQALVLVGLVLQDGVRCLVRCSV